MTVHYVPEVDVALPRTYVTGVPHAEFARLRRHAPVSWVDEPELVRHTAAGELVSRGSGFWAVTSHAGVVAASRDPAVFSSARRGAFLTDPRTRGDLVRARQLLVNMDAPEHLRVRRIVSAAFTARSVARIADSVHAHVGRLVARLHEKQRFDLVADLAAELPLLVLADLLGLPPEDRRLLYRWSNHLVGFDDPEFGGGDVTAYRRALTEAFGYAAAICRDRRARPTDDLCSLLANAEVDGAHLTVEEFAQFWLLLVVAGNETTRQLISGSLVALQDAPDQARRLVDGRAGGAAAVEELLRFVTPIMQFRRTATADTTLAGTAIARDDKVVLCYVAANRDPAVFERPDELLFDRPANPHLAFGTGPHFCLGANLARLEVGALLEALGPDLLRLEPTAPPVRLESNFVNGVKAMPATFAAGRSSR